MPTMISFSVIKNQEFQNHASIFKGRNGQVNNGETFIGTFGLFFTLFFLFIRFLPGIAVAEVKSVYRYARDNK